MMYKLIVSGVLALLFSGLQAQESLSLDEAIRIGLERNYDIRIERENVSIDSRNNSWGEAGRYPRVTINATYNNSITNVDQGDQFFSGQTFPGFELNNQKNGSITPSVGVNWTLFAGNRINISKKRLENLELESIGNAEIVVANSVQLIILAYYMAVLEQERLDVFKQQLGLSRDKYNYTKIRTDIGSAVSSDLLLDEVNFLNDSVNLENQQLRYRNAIRSLNFVIAEKEVDKNYVFTNDLQDELAEYSYEDLVGDIEDQNVDLRKQYLTQAILGNNYDLARSDRYPALIKDAGYNWSRSVQNLTDAHSPSDSYTPPPDKSITNRGNYFANFTLSFTLFDGNRINRAIQNAVDFEDIGNIQLEKLRSSVYRDLSDSYDQFTIRQKIFGINIRKEEAAATNLEISTDKYRNGTINSFEFRIVQNDRLQASISRLESLYDIIDSKVALMRLTGNLLNTFTER